MCAVLLYKTTEKYSNLLSKGRLKSSTRSRKRRCPSHLTQPLNWLAIVNKLWGTLGISRLGFPIRMRFCLNSGNSLFRILSRFKRLHSSRVLCKTRLYRRQISIKKGRSFKSTRNSSQSTQVFMDLRRFHSCILICSLV